MAQAAKDQVIAAAAERAGVSREQAATVLDSLADHIKQSVGSNGPGVCNVLGLLKVIVVTKPATAARKGINPFTNQEMTFKARPARRAVKFRALKELIDSAQSSPSNEPSPSDERYNRYDL